MPIKKLNFFENAYKWFSFDARAIYEKINELVAAVSSLETRLAFIEDSEVEPFEKKICKYCRKPVYDWHACPQTADYKVPVKEEWPKEEDEYWYIDSSEGAEAYESEWLDDETDHARRDFLGIFKTREEAEKRLAQVKELLKTV